MEIKANTVLKKRFPKQLFVEIHLKKLVECAELKNGLDDIETDINKIISTFETKTGRRINLLKIVPDGDKYKLLVEVQ